jgi:3-oxoacyl-[acyl-carrier-protein] synthase III
MKILSVAKRIPSREITNGDILSMIAENSTNISKRSLATYQRVVTSLLEKSGSRTRYVRDRRKEESAADLIKAAMSDAFERSGLGPKDIDLLIYCGVGKGFLEPANAYFYASSFDMDASCYDISDACMSWVRALEIFYHLQKSGGYKHAMVVNGEFNFYSFLYPRNFKIDHVNQIEYTFPSYTIGECASATVLTASDEEWSFDFKSVPELCDLCTIPLEWYREYVDHSRRLGLNGVNTFVSYGSELFRKAEEHLVELGMKCIDDLDEHDLYIPHAASDNAYLAASGPFIEPEKMYTAVYPKYGNLVSASIPAAIDLATDEGKLKKGDRVVLVPASAGMAFGVVQFTYI